jgi:D-alanyl-D-alanine carboxypeptidase
MTNKNLLKSVLLTAASILIGMSVAQADAVDDVVRSEMASKNIPGVAVAVVENGKSVKVKGYGYANLEHQIPVNPETVFLIGSVSKQMIAIGVMTLVQDGKLSLGDKAVKFLEGAPEAWSEITIRHLLTHTAGLMREGPGFSVVKAQPDSEVIKSAYASQLIFKTGDKFQYSNLGYFILAEIITKASGKPWPEYVEQRIFAPLNMTASNAVNVTSIVSFRADGYGYRNDSYQNIPLFASLRPSGAFMSSLNDMVKWDAALNKATLLPQTVLDVMWTPATLNDGKSVPYGFGWEIGKLGSHRTVSHAGALTGFRAAYLRLPDDGLSVIVLTNRDAAPSDTIAIKIAMEYIKDLIPNRNVVRVSATDLDAVAGSYRFSSGNVASFTREGKGLRFTSPANRMDILLLPNSPTLFFSDDNPRVHFVFDKSGSATRVTSYSNDVQQSTGAKE